jgi:DNA-directed RNA polymerase subunit RPC12/RpoP
MALKQQEERDRERKPSRTKPLRKQFSGSFICGTCHAKYRQRNLLRKHREQCLQDFARQNGLVREAKLKMRPLIPQPKKRPKKQKSKRSAPNKKGQGRKPLGIYICMRCHQEFASAQKRINHQRSCDERKNEGIPVIKFTESGIDVKVVKPRSLP